MNSDFENEKVHINVSLPEPMLQNIRRLYMEWVELIGIDYITTTPPDDELLLVVVDEWIDDKKVELVKQREIRKAFENGGRTGYLYDIDGNEYYTTIDGKRHYTRVEG